MSFTLINIQYIFNIEVLGSESIKASVKVYRKISKAYKQDVSKKIVTEQYPGSLIARFY